MNLNHNLNHRKHVDRSSACFYRSSRHIGFKKEIIK